MLLYCDNSINIYDISHPAIPVSIDLNGAIVSSIDVHPKQNKMYYVTKNDKIYEYNFISKVITSSTTEFNNLNKIKLSQNGKYAVISNTDNKIALYDISNFPIIAQISSHGGHTHSITAIACIEEPIAYFGGDSKGKISKFFVETDTKVSLLPGWTSGNGPITDLVYDETTNWLIITTVKGIWIHDQLQTRSVDKDKLKKLLTDDLPLCIAVSPQLIHTFAVGFKSGKFNVYEKTDFALRASKQFSGSVLSAVFDKQCQYFAVGIQGDSIYCVQQEPEKTIQIGTSTSAMCPFAFMPADKTLPMRAGDDITDIVLTIKKKAKETGKVYTEETTSSTTITKTTTKTPSIIEKIKQEAAVDQPESARKFITRRRQNVVQPIEKSVDANINMEKLAEYKEPVIETEVAKPEFMKIDPISVDLPQTKPQEKKVQDIAQTPPRIPTSPKFNAPEPEFIEKTKKQVPKKKKPEPEVKSDVSYDYSDIDDKDEECDQKTAKVLMRFMNDRFESMSQQINTIYLDLLCKMKGLEDRMTKIEKSVGSNK